jgi:LysM repeat protein
VRSEIKSFRTEIGEDSDGLPRVIDIRADIRFSIVGYTTKCGEMLGDAYSLTKGFSLTETTTEAFIRKDDITAQFVLKEPLSIEENLPPVKTVVDITGQIGQADITVNNDFIAVDGYVVCSVLYLADNSTRPVVSCKKQIPFSHTIERRGLKENTAVPLRLYVSHTSFSLLSPSEMELRIAIAARGEIIEKITFPVISGITDIVDVSDITSGRPSILVYIVQPGDTLLKIAKRYNAPIDALIAINEITDPDTLMPGEKLLISC